MKKRIMMLVAMLSLAVLTTTAQKSSKYLVGTVSYEKTTDADAVYSFSPMVGYYVTNKTSVGVFGEIGESADVTTSGIGAFVRNDFMKVGKSCDVFGQFSLASKSTKSSDVKVSEFNANLGLGANYSLSSKWSLTMNLTDVISYKSSEGVSTLKFGLGNISNPFSTAGFGIVYKF